MFRLRGITVRFVPGFSWQIQQKRSSLNGRLLDMSEPVMSFVYGLAVFALSQIFADFFLYLLEHFRIQNDLGCQPGRNDNDAVRIGLHDVARMNYDWGSALPRQHDWNSDVDQGPQSFVAHRADKGGKNGKAHLIAFIRVANAAIGHDTGTSADVPTQGDVAADHGSDLVSAGCNNGDAS